MTSGYTFLVKPNNKIWLSTLAKCLEDNIGWMAYYFPQLEKPNRDHFTPFPLSSPSIIYPITSDPMQKKNVFKATYK